MCEARQGLPGGYKHGGLSSGSAFAPGVENFSCAITGATDGVSHEPHTYEIRLYGPTPIAVLTRQLCAGS